MNRQEPSIYHTSIHESKAFAIGDYARAYHVEPHLHLNVPPPPASREQLLEAIHLASAELRHYPGNIVGIHLERAEVGQIVEWVRNAKPEEQLGMLLDQPGGGKTVVMRDVLMQLEALNVPVLAIKADNLSAIRSRADLAERLGLPAPVEECARVLASQGLFFVLLDQLDALSLALSRDQSTLSVMLSTLSRLRTMPNVQLVASCRTFDLNNDPHLSRVKVDRKFQLRPLDAEQVNRVLNALGINPAPLLPAHHTLLRVPLHLDIYARIITSETPKETPESYRTLQELYEGLWQRRIEPRLPNSAPPRERIQAIYKLVEVMKNRRQPKLTAPLATLDEYPDAANHLQRVQIIRREKSNWLFFHQTFFDYCYARQFVAEEGRLSQKILSGSQGLFYRSLMVQVLAYLRGSDKMAYRRQVRHLLFTDGLRTHLRLLLIGWFGSLPNPSVEELRIALRLMNNREDSRQFVRAIGGNESWFDRLKDKKLPSLLRATDENLLDLTLKYLTTMIDLRTQAVLALLRPYLDQSEAWNRRIASCLAHLDNWQNETAIEMFCDLLRRGSTARWAFYKLAKSNPAGGCRALRVYLDYGLNELLILERKAIEDADPDVAYQTNLPDRSSWLRSLLGEHALGKVLKAAVEACPDKLLEHLLPWFVKVSMALVKPRHEESYPSDFFFTWGWYDEHILGGPAFAKHIAEALKHFSRTNPIEFRPLATHLATVESLAVQRVLVHAYLADPETYADDISRYLVADTRRLSIGEEIQAPRYDSCRLVAAAFQYLSAERRTDLEEFILGWQPAWDKRNRGFGQLYFLKGIPLELLSETTQHKRRELERKFPNFEVRAPQALKFCEIESPIPQTAQEKMSDEAWLGAMRKYDEATRDFLKGGVEELSGDFAGQVKKETARFYSLAQRFDETISSRYIVAIISGLAQSDAPTEWVFDLVRQFGPRIELPGGVCWGLKKRAKDGVPDDLLDMMTDWALNEPAPESSRIRDKSGQRFRDDDDAHLHRREAIQAVCDCALQRQPPQVERAFQLLEQAATDPSTAVRACVIESLGPLLNEDHARTLIIFEQTVHDVHDHPSLLQSPLVHRFLYWTYYGHFPRFQPVICALLTNEDDETRQAGALFSCLAAFRHPEASPLVEHVMQGDAAMRRGAAQVYAHNLGHSKLRATCEQQLRLLMHDPDKQVRIYVSECFGPLQSEDVVHLRSFISEFLASPSLLAHPLCLYAYLTSLATDEYDIVLDAVEQTLEKTGDIRTESALLEQDVVRLSLAVYNYATDSATKSRAMTLFERLLLLGSAEAKKALGDWDRQ